MSEGGCHVVGRMLWTLAALAIHTALLASAQHEPLRVVFHGYTDAQPRTAIAEIVGLRLTNTSDLDFVRAGGDLSPDGTRVAFDSCRKGDRGIDVANVDGTDVQRIVPLQGDSCAYVRWSRDSKRLSYSNPVGARVHVVDLETRVENALTSTSPAYGLHSWSPANDAIVYETGRGGERRLDVIDLANGRTRPLVGKSQFGSCEVWAPDWSPAGDLIAFTTCKGELYVVNAAGSRLTRLADSAYAPRWSPDGTSLLYLTGRTLLAVRPTGGAPRRIGEFRYYGGPFSVGPLR
jgi:Tol biopolymer transport system component